MFKFAVRFATGAMLLSAAVCASADSGTYQDVTISAVFQETVVPSAHCSSGQSGNLAGFGTSAELGRVAFLSSDCFSVNAPVFTFSNGKLVLTTTSGDVLFANYSGQVVATGEGSKGVLNGATFQITGGTGKYKHSQGAGTMTGTEDLATGQGSLQLKGRVLLKE